MTAASLAAELTDLGLEGISDFVRALPKAVFVSLVALADERVWYDRLASLPSPTAVVATTAADADEILTAEEAARVLRVSLDTLYARVHRGEVATLPRCRGGRLKFRRGDLHAAPVAACVDQRYSPRHDSTGRAKPAKAARLDATPARGGARRHDDDRRAVGARRARGVGPRRDEPWAPGQGAWADPQGDPRPKGGLT